ncbi:MAG TPA: anti-sigma factor, partial [Dermatophilaceae bacterium]
AVWQRIVAGIAAPADAVQPERAGAEAAAPTPAEPAPGSVPMTSVARLPRRRLNPAVLAAAAALVGVVIGAGTMFGATRNNPTAPPAAAPAVQIVLQPLDTPAAHGTAVLDHSAGEKRILTVHVQGLPSVRGTFYEVWLMNATPQRLLSLGVLDSSHAGQFQIPAGLDLGRYPVVDVSLQPFNGSPAHSGTSAVRGTLPA